MSSIYSHDSFQRIMDHWGIGSITDTTAFASIGKDIWRHLIKTPQGDFELYSYLPERAEYCEQQLAKYLSGQRGKRLSDIAHCFSRYNVAVQLTKRSPISPNQAKIHLESLLQQLVNRAFRAYGTIVQMRLENGLSFYSYGSWIARRRSDRSLEENCQRPPSLIESNSFAYDQIDDFLGQVEKDRPILLTYQLTPDGVELNFADNLQVRFTATKDFPALVVSTKKENCSVHVWNSSNISYEIDL